jgi:hypothetical protein
MNTLVKEPRCSEVFAATVAAGAVTSVLSRRLLRKSFHDIKMGICVEERTEEIE